MRRSGVALLVLLVLITGSSTAAAAVAAAGPAGFVVGFATPVVLMPEGDGVTFVNGDVAPHNFISSDAFVPKKKAKKVEWCSGYTAGKCPLFWSNTITAGQSTEVQGLERVLSGKQYAFFCSLHPNMKGTLVVP